MTTYIYTSNKNILKVNVEMTIMKLQKQGRKSNYSNPYYNKQPIHYNQGIQLLLF